MPVNTPALGVVAGLEAVAAWREAAERQFGPEAERLRAEISRLKLRLAEAEAALAAAEAPDLSEEDDARTRAAVWSGLSVDRAALEARGAQLAGARADRARALATESDPALRAELDDLGATLAGAGAGLPDAWERAIEQRRAQVQARIDALHPMAEAALEEAPPGDTLAVAAVMSLEPSAGPPTALAVVLPVPVTVWSDWRAHGDDLCARLAWRVVAVLAESLRDVGAEDAPMRFTDRGGLLAIQVWLADNDVQGDLRGALAAGLDALNDDARELRAAAIELYGAWLEPAVLEGGPHAA